MQLMYKDTVVADIQMKRGIIWKIDHIYDMSMLPLGIYPADYNFSIDAERNADILDSWWRNNAIPTERDSIRKGLECIGIETPEELKFLSHGVSLLNHYWIKEENENLQWRDLNYWDNAFSDEVGVALFNHKAVHSPLNMLSSPDAGINGALKKCWIKKQTVLNDTDYDAICQKTNDKYRYYLKKSGTGSYRQEVYNEVFASKLYEIIGIMHADYQLHNDPADDDYTCISRCFTSDKTDFIPLFQLWDSVPYSYLHREKSALSDYDKMLAVCEYYQIEDEQSVKKYINDMLCIDYILAQSDRHINNIGFIRDVTTKEITLSPIYDSGSCLWYDKSFSRPINGIDDSVQEAKPFGGVPASGTWNKQIEYINDYVPLPKDKLMAATEEHFQALLNVAKMPEDRVRLIAHFVLERARRLQLHLMEKTPIEEMKYLDSKYVLSTKDVENFDPKSIQLVGTLNKMAIKNQTEIRS